MARAYIGTSLAKMTCAQLLTSALQRARECVVGLKSIMIPWNGTVAQRSRAPVRAGLQRKG